MAGVVNLAGLWLCMRGRRRIGGDGDSVCGNWSCGIWVEAVTARARTVSLRIRACVASGVLVSVSRTGRIYQWGFGALTVGIRTIRMVYKSLC